MIGVGVRLTLRVLPFLFKFNMKKRAQFFQGLKERVLSRDPLAYGTFLGSFLCLFESTMSILKESKDLNEHWRPIFAGSLAGLSLWCVPKVSLLKEVLMPVLSV